MNCDEHQKTIAKMGKKLEDYRPDVTHQSLLALLDSPLNQAGLLQVYIRSAQNCLIEVSPSLRVPRTFKSFSAMMAQCLTKLKVRAAVGSATLLNVIKNPITDHLPLGTQIVGTSSQADLKSMKQYTNELSPKGTKEEFKPIAFVVGAVSIGNPGMENNFGAETNICIASTGLSAACVCSKICTSYEEHWGIV